MMILNYFPCNIRSLKLLNKSWRLIIAIRHSLDRLINLLVKSVTSHWVDYGVTGPTGWNTNLPTWAILVSLSS